MAVVVGYALLVALLARRFWRGLQRGDQLAPFLCSPGVFGLCFIGLAISTFPLMAAPSVTIWQAAVRHDSQAFLLVGVLVLIPTILACTGYAHYVFRGEVQRWVGYQ